MSALICLIGIAQGRLCMQSELKRKEILQQTESPKYGVGA